MQETFCLLLEGVVVVITLSSALAFRAATRPRPHDSHLDAATLGRGTQKRLLETTTGWQLVFRQTAPSRGRRRPRDALGVGPRGAVLLVARLERSGKVSRRRRHVHVPDAVGVRRGREQRSGGGGGGARGAPDCVAAGVAPARRGAVTQGFEALSARPRARRLWRPPRVEAAHPLPLPGVPGRDAAAAYVIGELQMNEWGGLAGAATRRRRPNASSCTSSCPTLRRREAARARRASADRLPLEKLGITPPPPEASVSERRYSYDAVQRALLEARSRDSLAANEPSDSIKTQEATQGSVTHEPLRGSILRTSSVEADWQGLPGAHTAASPPPSPPAPAPFKLNFSEIGPPSLRSPAPSPEDRLIPGRAWASSKEGNVSFTDLADGSPPPAAAPPKLKKQVTEGRLPPFTEALLPARLSDASARDSFDELPPRELRRRLLSFYPMALERHSAAEQSGEASAVEAAVGERNSGRGMARAPKKAKPNKATPTPQLTLDRLSSVTAVAADLMPQKPRASSARCATSSAAAPRTPSAVGAPPVQEEAQGRRLEAAKAKAEAEEAAARAAAERDPEGAARSDFEEIRRHPEAVVAWLASFARRIAEELTVKRGPSGVMVDASAPRHAAIQLLFELTASLSHKRRWHHDAGCRALAAQAADAIAAASGEQTERRKRLLAGEYSKKGRSLSLSTGSGRLYVGGVGEDAFVELRKALEERRVAQVLEALELTTGKRSAVADKLQRHARRHAAIERIKAWSLRRQAMGALRYFREHAADGVQTASVQLHASSVLVQPGGTCYFFARADDGAGKRTAPAEKDAAAAAAGAAGRWRLYPVLRLLSTPSSLPPRGRWPFRTAGSAPRWSAPPPLLGAVRRRERRPAAAVGRRRPADVAPPPSRRDAPHAAAAGRPRRPRRHERAARRVREPARRLQVPPRHPVPRRDQIAPHLHRGRTTSR